MTEHNWMETYTGVRFYPTAPRAEDIRIVDIAHALSMQCRYAGHCRGFYSVAEHCCILTDWAYHSRSKDPRDLLHVLLHDAAEAYLHDVVRPLKPFLPEYRAAEDRLQGLILSWAGLCPQCPKPSWVDEIDSRICMDERAQNMSRNDNYWEGLQHLEPLEITLRFWDPSRAEHEFLHRWEQLTL